jgi:hypothetical protein
MTTEYNLKGCLTFGGYLECHKILAAKRRLWIRSIVILYGVGMVVYGLIIAPSGPDFTLTTIAAIFLAYGLIISPIQFRYRVKRNWDRYPKIKKEFDITILSDGVQIIDDKGNPSHSSWGSFLRFRESKSLFLLYLSPLLPLCLPKRLVADAEIDGLRGIISTAIEQQSRPDLR